MGLSLVATCPIDGLSLGAAIVTAQIGENRDVDGDFARDASQHVHHPCDTTMLCANGHRWRVRGDVLVIRET